MPFAHYPKNLVGHKFNRLTVIERAGKDDSGVIWRCRCDCGKESNVRRMALTLGRIKSCGCLKIEVTTARNFRHGMRHTVIGSIWKGIITRCYNPKSKSFKNYGGRGITACEFVRSSPVNLLFLLGERPPGRLTVERINNNIGYACGSCPECLSNSWTMNLKWATYAEQNRNNRHNRFVTIDGVKKCIKDWATDLGIPHTSFRKKLRDGMVEGAVVN